MLQKNTDCLSFWPRVAYDGVYFFVSRYDQPPGSHAPNAPIASDGAAGPRVDGTTSVRGMQRPAWTGLSAVRVNSEGQIIDPDDIRIARAGSWQTEHELTFGDEFIYLVTHNQRYVSWRISTDGQVLDSVPHANSGKARTCFDGLNFLLLCAGDSSGKLAGCASVRKEY